VQFDVISGLALTKFARANSPVSLPWVKDMSTQLFELLPVMVPMANASAKQMQRWDDDFYPFEAASVVLMVEDPERGLIVMLNTTLEMPGAPNVTLAQVAAQLGNARVRAAATQKKRAAEANAHVVDVTFWLARAAHIDVSAPHPSRMDACLCSMPHHVRLTVGCVSWCAVSQSTISVLKKQFQVGNTPAANRKGAAVHPQRKLKPSGLFGGDAVDEDGVGDDDDFVTGPSGAAGKRGDAQAESRKRGVDCWQAFRLGYRMGGAGVAADVDAFAFNESRAASQAYQEEVPDKRAFRCELVRRGVFAKLERERELKAGAGSKQQAKRSKPSADCRRAQPAQRPPPPTTAARAATAEDADAVDDDDEGGEAAEDAGPVSGDAPAPMDEAEDEMESEEQAEARRFTICRESYRHIERELAALDDSNSHFPSWSLEQRSKIVLHDKRPYSARRAELRGVLTHRMPEDGGSTGGALGMAVKKQLVAFHLRSRADDPSTGRWCLGLVASEGPTNNGFTCSSRVPVQVWVTFFRRSRMGTASSSGPIFAEAQAELKQLDLDGYGLHHGGWVLLWSVACPA
jgi:hypothetical protein